MDDGWEIKGDSPLPPRNPDGTIITNEKFPAMKALGDSIHLLGLKFGIYQFARTADLRGLYRQPSARGTGCTVVRSVGDRLPEVRLVFLREAGEGHLAVGTDASVRGDAQGP